MSPRLSNPILKMVDAKQAWFLCEKPTAFPKCTWTQCFQDGVVGKASHIRLVSFDVILWYVEYYLRKINVVLCLKLGIRGLIFWTLVLVDKRISPAWHNSPTSRVSSQTWLVDSPTIASIQVSSFCLPACVLGEFAVVYSPVKFICDRGKEAEKKNWNLLMCFSQLKIRNHIFETRNRRHLRSQFVRNYIHWSLHSAIKFPFTSASTGCDFKEAWIP